MQARVEATLHVANGDPAEVAIELLRVADLVVQSDQTFGTVELKRHLNQLRERAIERGIINTVLADPSSELVQAVVADSLPDDLTSDDSHAVVHERRMVLATCLSILTQLPPELRMEEAARRITPIRSARYACYGFLSWQPRNQRIVVHLWQRDPSRLREAVAETVSALASGRLIGTDALSQAERTVTASSSRSGAAFEPVRIFAGGRDGVVCQVGEVIEITTRISAVLHALRHGSVSASLMSGIGLIATSTVLAFAQRHSPTTLAADFARLAEDLCCGLASTAFGAALVGVSIRYVALLNGLDRRPRPLRQRVAIVWTTPTYP